MNTLLSRTALCSLLLAMTNCLTAQAAIYNFISGSDWGGVSQVNITQSAYNNGSGGTADITSWEIFSLLFNDLDGADLHGSIKSSDLGVSMSASFTVSPDKQNLLLTMTVTASDPRYHYSTWPEIGVMHGAQAWGWDWSHNGGSYWQHTTQGEWALQPVPEPSTYLAGLSAVGMLGLLGWRNRK